jgi:Cdc6-like AAA superfamily ATPase
MPAELDIEEHSLSERVVLLGVTRLEQTAETPAHTGEVMRVCADHVDRVDADVLGKVSEAEVNRALNALEDVSVVETVTADSTSPVGKGRPTYTLAADADAVLETLRTDDRLQNVVEYVEDAT